jgi:uncharacterized protein (TIGR02145 family)
MISNTINYRFVFVGLMTLFMQSCNPDVEDTNDPSNNGGSGNNNGGGANHSCGIANLHNPSLIYGSVQDADDNTYKTIVIGDQTWMAENLNTSVYRNGDPIENITEIHDWLHSDTIEEGAWCYYNNNGSAFECPYGKLYNYYAINDPRGVCPVGWHVPSDGEWQELIGTIDPAINLSANGYSAFESDSASFAMTSIWELPSPFLNTNRVGFSSLEAGHRFPIPTQQNDFEGVGNYSSYWSSTSQVNPQNQSEIHVKGRMISWVGHLYRLDYPTNAGLTIRCVID